MPGAHETHSPHDPGFEVVREVAAAVMGAARMPIKIAGGGEVRIGTASWTDPTMTAAGVFYPDYADTAEERLRYYAGLFPLVEVDSSYYVIPARRQSQLWVERTPPHFVMDVKAHALMTGQPSEVKRLPRQIRDVLPDHLKGRSRIYRGQLPADIYDAIWDYFNRGIEPLRTSGKLGTVLYQLPRWVFPSDEAREQILDAKRRLGDILLAVEFRHGSWLSQKNIERTLRFLTDNGLPYVVVDEPQGFKSSMSLVVAVTSHRLAVFRFHGRRADTWEKPNVPSSERSRYFYDEDELASWAPRIAGAARSAAQTHVIMTNCFANYCTTNAMQLARLLEQYQS